MFRVVGVIFVLAIVRAEELISFHNGQIGVNLGGYRASAGLGGLLTGNAADGGLSASAGTPLGHHAAAGLGGSVGAEAAGGLYASAGTGINKGNVASAGIYGSSDSSLVAEKAKTGAANGGFYKYASFDAGHSFQKGIAPISHIAPTAPVQPVEPVFPIVPVAPSVPETSIQKVTKLHHVSKTKLHSRLHDKHFAAKEVAVEQSTDQGGALNANTGHVGGGVGVYGAANQGGSVYGSTGHVGGAGIAGAVGGAGAAGSSGAGFDAASGPPGGIGATYSSSSTFQFNKHGAGLLDDIFAIPIATLQAVNQLVRNRAAEAGSAQFSFNKYKTFEHTG